MLDEVLLKPDVDKTFNPKFYYDDFFHDYLTRYYVQPASFRDYTYTLPAVLPILGARAHTPVGQFIIHKSSMFLAKDWLLKKNCPDDGDTINALGTD